MESNIVPFLGPLAQWLNLSKPVRYRSSVSATIRIAEPVTIWVSLRLIMILVIVSRQKTIDSLSILPPKFIVNAAAKL